MGACQGYTDEGLFCSVEIEDEEMFCEEHWEGIWALLDELTTEEKEELIVRLSEESPGKRLRLQGADLRGVLLRSANLDRADLNGAYLEGVYLRKAHLEGAYLRKAHLEGASLLWAHLEGADLTQARLILQREFD